MADQIPNYNSAEALRKDKKYDEALPAFEALWQQQPNAFYGWRYAQCLRKANQPEKAELIARAVLEKSPEDKYTKNELGWILYDKELKPAKDDSDLGRTVHFANEILKLNTEGFILKRVALVVMKVAKTRGKWDVVLEWSNKLKPADLDTHPITVDGRAGMPERETWYVNRANVLLKLERYGEARAFAQEGIKEYPNELFLARTAALALASSGDVQNGALEMRQLLIHRRADWYVKADLATLEFQLGNYTEAYRLMCEAVSNPQDDEYKLGCFVTLAQIGLALNKLDIAAEHIALAKAVRAQNSWSTPSELVQAEKAVQAALNANGQSWPDLPPEVDQLSKRCHQRWREGSVEGVVFIKGTLKRVDPAKPYVFIKRDDGGADIFARVRDIPKKCLHDGARLEFTLKKSFDQKKNCESVEATQIRCVS
jgi:tetratricopeptide (TPR) repeat protein/cold shock CspA family protein